MLIGKLSQNMPTRLLAAQSPKILDGRMSIRFSVDLSHAGDTLPMLAGVRHLPGVLFERLNEMTHSIERPKP